MNKPSNLTALATFLAAAHKTTYADATAKKVQPSRLRSHDYRYTEGAWLYHDTYFGARNFIGSEIVYKDRVPVWGMNYQGYLCDGGQDQGSVYRFLRQALLQDCEPLIPARGPADFTEGEWCYRARIKGELGRFTGSEEILYAGKQVYFGDFHGGGVG